MARSREHYSGRGSSEYPSGGGLGGGRGRDNSPPPSPPHEEVEAGASTEPEVQQVRAPAGPRRRMDGRVVIGLDGNNK